MFRKFFLPIAALGAMLFFIQCSEVNLTPADQNTENSVLKAGNGHGSGNGSGNGSGKGKGNGGINAGNGGGGGIYGDLTICLRNANGVPYYLSVEDAEKGETTYYAQPIKINSINSEPKRLNPFESPFYEVFAFNEELGEFEAPDGVYIVKEVEFGRTNMTRAPQSVFKQALAEAIKTLEVADDILTDASGRMVAIFGNEDWKVNFDDDPANDESNDKTIDSPSEDLAIYQELMSNGLNGDLAFLKDRFGYSDDDVLRLAYGAFAGSADKTGIVVVDQIAYINDFIIDWKSSYVNELDNSPDDRGRHYYDFSGFTYSRSDRYNNMYVRITELRPNGTWENVYVCLNDINNAIINLLNGGPLFTDPLKLIDYSNGANTNISGFANATNDAVQVLEFIHSSDQIVYSPYFTASGFNPAP